MGKKEFAKIYIYIASAISIILACFSFIMYSKVESVVESIVQKNTAQSVYQFSSKINMFNENIKTFGYDKAINSDVLGLMKNENPNIPEIFSILDQIKLSAYNENYYSTTIYSTYVDKMYHTKAIYVDIVDEDLRNMLSTPLGQSYNIVSRVLKKEYYFEEKKVFTYIFHSASKMGAVAINVTLDWIKQEISLNDKNGKIFIVDSGGTILYDSSRENIDYGDEKFALFDKIPINTEAGYFVQNIDGKKKIFNFQNVKGSVLSVIVEQDINCVIAPIKNLKNITIIMTLVFFVIALGMSLSISKRAYRPYMQIINEIKKGLNEEIPSSLEDIEFVHTVLEQHKKKLETFEQHTKKAEDYLEIQKLKNLLLSKNVENNGTVSSMVSDEGVYLAYCVFDSTEGISNIEFFLDNTLFAFSDNCIILQMTHNTFCAIIEYKGHIMKTLKLTSRMLPNATNIIPSVFVSDKVFTSDMFYGTYLKLMELSQYRVIYGKNCILGFDNFSKYEENIYPINYEETLFKSIEKKDMACTFEAMGGFIKEAGMNKPENFLFCMVNLMSNLLGRFKIPKLEDFSMSSMRFKIYKAVDIDEICLIFEDLINEMLSIKKYDDVISAAKKYLDENYMSDNISLKSLAAEFKMSTAYFGNRFKKECGVTVNDYIAKKRMDNAAELLACTKLSIKEIMKRSGFNNEGYFYKSFKKVYDVTPNDYRIYMSVVKLNNSDSSKLNIDDTGIL